MNSGVKVNLGEITDLQVGYPFKSKDYSESPGAVKLVRGDNVVQGSFRWENVKKIEVKDVLPEVMQKYSLALYDVTLAMDRPWIAAGLKYSSVSEDDLPCLLVQRVCRLRAKDNLDQRFLKYVIGSAEFTAHIRNFETGTAVPHISQSSIAEFSFSLPPLENQKAIAHILGTLDDKIELNQQMTQTLEEIAKAIFKSWFVDFDPVRAKAEGRPTGLPPEISDLFPDELVDSEIGEIPKGWRTSPLLSLCKKIESGGTPSRKTAEYWDAGTISWFKTGEFCDSPLLNSEEHITPLGLTKSAAKEWAPQTILFAMYGATVGKMAYLTGTGTANQAVAGISPDENFGFAFVWQTLISGRSRLMSLANGAAQQNLNLGLVKDFTVIMPTAELAKTFSNTTNSIYQRITLLYQESDCLSKLRDTLLPRLISGELRIPDAEKFLEEAGI